jgi:hypothetical protein
MARKLTSDEVAEFAEATAAPRVPLPVPFDGFSGTLAEPGQAEMTPADLPVWFSVPPRGFDGSGSVS